MLLCPVDSLATYFSSLGKMIEALLTRENLQPNYIHLFKPIIENKIFLTPLINKLIN